MSTNHPRLAAKTLTLAYDKRVIVEDLDVRIADESFTVIVGPNACGKSTLLKSLARVLKPRSGAVLLDGQAIASYPSKQVARQLGMLPQSPVVPGGIVVEELVARGRFAHQRLLSQWSPQDEAAVTDAMRRTEVADLADRFVDELSGGQRQRVWLARALAQQTPILLLDEPTTFLDLSHQFEVLDLCAVLHEQGRTIVAVLHDLNQACRYATELIVMKDGEVLAQGAPAEVMTAELVERVFAMPCRVMDDPETGTPMIVPAGRERRNAARTGRTPAMDEISVD
ncbi:ABC transporter ATP-binding protein [Actinoplanes sp. KI2]|uniref:ABC transporter ATP-binding protein n=1 Tax=Actinoplanes sp. KI2 TaxID=2983315 RepID=UPI0021D612B6|nr:ABC transporter ATP-binding protein [Actinoplanes sp. KI2]MCU7729901.1 ABC transporter ATP-binding protein [Actinoplanes sp. KI2]